MVNEKNQTRSTRSHHHSRTSGVVAASPTDADDDKSILGIRFPAAVGTPASPPTDDDDDDDKSFLALNLPAASAAVSSPPTTTDDKPILGVYVSVPAPDSTQATSSASYYYHDHDHTTTFNTLLGEEDTKDFMASRYTTDDSEFEEEEMEMEEEEERDPLPVVMRGPCRTRKGVPLVLLNEAVERDLGEWYREHPIFYDKAKRGYKDSAKKNRLFEEKAASLNPPLTGTLLFFFTVNFS